MAEWLPRDAGTLVWSSATLNSALNSCICLGKLLFPFFSVVLKKADLCTQLVLIFQMGEIGLVHGNGGDISLICCFNLSLNFWTNFIDFFSLEKPRQFFSCKLFSPSPSHGHAGESRMLLAKIPAGESRNICLCTAESLESKNNDPGKAVHR